jgi:predicted ATPase
MASAEVPPQEIYTAGERIFELQHAVSRLIEMQSEDITSPPARGVRQTTLVP